MPRKICFKKFQNFVIETWFFIVFIVDIEIRKTNEWKFKIDQ